MNEAALRVLKVKNEQHWQARGRYATIYCLGIDSIRPHRRYVPDPNSGNIENAKIRPVEKNDGTQMDSDENFLLVVRGFIAFEEYERNLRVEGFIPPGSKLHRVRPIDKKIRSALL